MIEDIRRSSLPRTGAATLLSLVLNPFGKSQRKTITTDLCFPVAIRVRVRHQALHAATEVVVIIACLAFVLQSGAESFILAV